MNEEILLWMNRTYPNGFAWVNLSTLSLEKAPFEGFSFLNLPLLLHINTSQLQDFIANMMEQGVSPASVCYLPEQNVSGALCDIALKVRALGLSDFLLVIAE